MFINKIIDHSTDAPVDANDLYLTLALRAADDDRPYVFANMVSTVDGKIIVGPKGSSAKGVGGTTDQMLLRRIRDNADAVIIGAGTMRPNHVIYPPELWRVTLTRSGDLPFENRFFIDAPERTIVFAPENIDRTALSRLKSTIKHVRLVGDENVDIREACTVLRQEFGIAKLLLEGGSELNFEFMEAGCVDELFWSLAPKLKGGRDMPTIVGGKGLPKNDTLPLELISLYHDDDEFYFRYRLGEHRGLPLGG